MTKKIKVVESFAGVGSQHIAMGELGIDFEVVATSEWDINAIITYDAIHRTSNEDFSADKTVEEMNDFLSTKCISKDGKEPMTIEQIKRLPIAKKKRVYNSMIRHNNLGSISTLQAKDVPNHDFFTYSFPCQDISIAGLEKGLDEGGGTRSGLLWDCRKVIEGKLPKYLMMENVKNLVNKKHKPNFDKWLAWLETQGYTNYWKVVNGTDYGVPQNRERVFVFSIRGEHTPYEFPEAEVLEETLRDWLDKKVDDKFYLSSKMKDYILDKNETQKGTKWEGRANGDVLNPSIAHTIGCRSAAGNQRAGVSNFIIDDRPDNVPVLELKKEDNDNLPIRRLTPGECYRLMGFTDEEFERAESVTSNAQLYNQSGNTIIVNVLVALFKNLFN